MGTLVLLSILALLNRLPPQPQGSAPEPATAKLSPDSPASSHPVERAVANGEVQDERIEAEPNDTHWTRTRLVKLADEPRLMRVVERWELAPDGTTKQCILREMFLADQVLIKTKTETTADQLQSLLSAHNLQIAKKISDSLFTIRIGAPHIDAVPEAIALLRMQHEIVDTVEADGYGFGGGDPNDPRFSDQWGLKNAGQNGGETGADVNATQFWKLLDSAPDVVVAVLDSGLNFTHPDLQGISWVNPDEIANDNIDNDSSGKIDDIHGWDFVNNDNDPTDDHGHGSNVTGIIAANRNDSIGISGMLAEVQVLSCKILNSSNGGTTSNLIAATRYARERGVSVMNLSLQNYPNSSLLAAEFTLCEEAGIVLSICGGNQGVNNDSSPNYPSSFPHANIISVGNHDRTDTRWDGSFNPSNYGESNVDLFAPGRQILSPILNNSYSYYTGTSQAAPFVTAACIAILQVNPSWKAPEVKNAILDTVVTRQSYENICASGGRLDAAAALSHAIVQGDSQDNDQDGFSNLFELLAGTRIDQYSSQPLLSSELENGVLKIRVPRQSREDAKLEVEISSNLVSWSDAGLIDLSSPETLLNGVMTSNSEKVFLRIKAVTIP